MEKILIYFFSVYIFLGCSKSCTIEEEKVKEVTLPLVKKLANYARNNGMPNELKDVTNIQYEIRPCPKDLKYKSCLVVNNEIYQIKLWKFPSNSSPKGFGLDVIYKDTHCLYTIYNNQKIENNYLKPNCSVAGHCHNEWFQ